MFFGLDAALFLRGQLGVGLQRRHRLLDLRQPFLLIAGRALADLGAWLKEGKLKVEEDVINGLENTPAALIGLLPGENRAAHRQGLTLCRQDSMHRLRQHFDSHLVYGLSSRFRPPHAGLHRYRLMNLMI
jgi:hypothetical protein